MQIVSITHVHLFPEQRSFIKNMLLTSQSPLNVAGENANRLNKTCTSVSRTKIIYLKHVINITNNIKCDWRKC